MSWDDGDSEHKKLYDWNFLSCEEPHERLFIRQIVKEAFPQVSDSAIDAAISSCCATMPAPRPRKAFLESIRQKLGVWFDRSIREWHQYRCVEDYLMKPVSEHSLIAAVTGKLKRMANLMKTVNEIRLYTIWKEVILKKILVVDDEEIFRQMVVATLKRNGFETLEADDGLSAFELAKAHIPALIISDVMMYSGSGFILREFLKREPRTANIPLILMSGKAQDAGAWGSDPDVEYFVKPFDVSQLLSAVQRMVKRD